MVFLGATANLVHIIDSDYRRRARVAREFHARNLHAEIYEDLEEFGQHPPKEGFIFAADDATTKCRPNDIAQVLQSVGKTLPLVVYAAQPSPQRIVSAILDGALDYLEWPFDPSLLNSAFRRLATEGERRSQQARLRSAAVARVSALSGREHEVLTHLAMGMSNIEMADALGISPRTVEIHRGNMMRKLGANSASDAVRMALYAGLDENFESLV